MNRIQNKGSYFTNEAADLAGIYSQILGQLSPAATALPGSPLVSTTIPTNYNVVPGSISVSKGDFILDGQNIDWNLQNINNEIVSLNYSIIADESVCGNSVLSESIISYENSNCDIITEVFDSSEVCVPCPVLETDVVRVGCSNSFNFIASIEGVTCVSLGQDFLWEFLLDGNVVGQSNEQTGVFTYSGTEPLSGELNARVDYIGSYEGPCSLPVLSQDFVLSIPEPLNFSVANVNDVLCNGESTASIDIDVSGGYPPYTYLWSNGATSQDLDNIGAGSYNLIVSDSNGCSFEIDNSIVISEPVPGLSIIGNVSNISCFDGDDGEIELIPAGGVPPYEYLWSNGETTQNIIDLEVGTYTVILKDSNLCEAEATFTVEQPTAALSIADTITNVLCNGDSSGVVQLAVSGGTAPYTYEWSDGSTAVNLEDVTAGSYSVVVTDANDCVIQQSFTITEPDSPLSINLTRENATTAQNCEDGTATAAVTGGTAPYSYLWSNGATVASISDLSDGTYSVTVTDANGCELTQSVVVDCINTCDAVIAIGTVTDVLCASEETGSTTVSASSEANPGALFTFTWSNGEVDAGVTSSTLNNIGAGVYTVSVTIDGTVCQPVEQSVTVSEPSSAVGVTISTEDETGPGLSNGEATASATGGVAPYTYSWSNGATTAQIDNLSPGDYTVEVTDDNGCTVESTVTINPGSCNNLSITTSVENVSCNGFSDGSVGSNTTGGVGPFTYSWSNGATTENINNVEAGNYTVTVTDTFTNCTAQSTVAVNEPTVLSAGIAVNNVLCFGESTGSLNLTVSGGTLDYTYEWSSGQTIEDLTGLPAGNYSVVVTDGNGCTTTASAVINEPTSAVTADVSSINENGATSNDGTATAIPEGGTPPYTISWSNGETTETISGLDAGDYTVEVTDANGCRYEETITVASTNQVPAPVNDSATTSEDTAVEIDVTDNDNFGSDGPNDSVIVITEQPDNGTVTVDDGGTPNDPTDDSVIYTPDPDFNGTDTFEYEITDSNGDSETATVVVTVNPIADVVDDADTTPEDTPVNIDVLDNDTFDPAADVAVTDVTDPANGTVVINDDGTVTYTPDPDFNGEDTFEYTVTVTNPD
ncbi:Ig-like domain-containing protein, partial [Dokdonia genika]